MPRNPINYSKTIMYKIVCNNLEIKDCYVGHTTDFIRRKAEHKYNCNNEKKKDYNYKVYQFIRENEGWDNWSMIMIEKYCCSSLLEATKRERELYEELQGTLNSYTPSRNKKEYYDEFKDKLLEHNKLYYQNNKDILKEKSLLYYQDNLEKIKEYKKNYCEENRDKIKEYQDNYRLEHNNKIKCDCGRYYTFRHKTDHFKTKIHQNYSSSLLTT
jgi:hypothetical protein